MSRAFGGEEQALGVGGRIGAAAARSGVGGWAGG